LSSPAPPPLALEGVSASASEMTWVHAPEIFMMKHVKAIS
jgi:hypothetical protein